MKDDGIDLIEPGRAKVKVNRSNVVGFSSRPKKSGNDSESAPYGSYQNIGGAIHHIRSTKNGPFPVKLCNFTAKIESVRVVDDGLQRQTKLIITGIREDGLRLPEIEVIDAKFFSGSWVNESWGVKARVEPTQSAARRVTDAVLLYSTIEEDVPTLDSRAYLGWECNQDSWRYMTGGGAITENGIDESINVELFGNMSRYRLPAPNVDRCKAAFPRIQQFLQISQNNPKVGSALLAAAVRAPLYYAAAIDFSLLIVGTSGCKKSSVTAVALSFFGDFSFRTLPQNWHSSENDIEMSAHAAHCSLFCVDDWKLGGGTQAEAARMRSKMERFGQSTGNQAGRGRRNADLSARPTPHNRSMTVITAEEKPSSTSLLARMLILPIAKNDVDITMLTELQAAARSGELSEIMSCFIHWLAPRMSELCKSFPDKIVDKRASAIAEGFAASHPRAPDIFASLASGIDIFFQFAVDINAIDKKSAEKLVERIESNLKAAFIDQMEHQQEADVVRRFLALLATALASGSSHLADASTDHIPARQPERFGWRRNSGFLKRDTQERTTDAQSVDTDGKYFEYEPRGTRIGWVSRNEIWIDADAAFAAAQSVASQQREPILTTKNAILQQMVERGIITETHKRATGTIISTVARTVNGNRRRVAVIMEQSLFDQEYENEQN